MAARNTGLRRSGGNGTGYTYEIFDVTDEVADYALIPVNTYFKYIDKLPGVDVVLFKNSSGEVVDPSNPNFFPDIWIATHCL